MPSTHLVPEESSGSKPTAAHMDQANEHDENQENIRHKRDDHGNFSTFDIWRHAHAARSYPSRAKLRKYEFRWFNTIEVI